jgi:hypothetical protein
MKNSSYLPTYEDGTDSVPKCWHIKFRRRGITQKKAYNKRRNAKWTGHIWHRNCLPKHPIKGNIKGRTDVTGR